MRARSIRSVCVQSNIVLATDAQVLRRPSRVPAVQVEAKQVLPAEGRERATLRPVRHLQLPDDTAAVGSQIKYQIKPGRAPSPQPTENPVSDFMTKLKMAWDIFFPERQPDVTPKEEGKQRLRMILVADRCGMSPAGLAEMKKTILKVRRSGGEAAAGAAPPRQQCTAGRM